MRSHPQAAVFHQGLRSFIDFEDYYENWIKSNLVPDLETVLEGARKWWEDRGRPKNGRGDFMLAIPLFAAMEHVGSFLARDRSESLLHHDNIARIARRLPSTATCYAILANLGRNALVHGAWPQTGFGMDDGTWGFGLNVTADPNLEEHNIIYSKMYSIGPRAGARPVKVLKLVLNVHCLRRELADWITTAWDPKTVDAGVFLRMQDASVERGRPLNPARYQQLFGGVSTCDAGEMWDQIRDLRDEAVRMKVWHTAGLGTRRDRPSWVHSRWPR